MENNNLAVQAKVALTNLYHWAVDHLPLGAKPSAAASRAASLASSFVGSYLNPSHTQSHATHSLYLHYQPPHHTATPASSSSSSGAGSRGADHQGESCYSNNPQDAPHTFLNIILQSFGSGGCTSRSWDPVASFDSFLWNYTPDIRSLQEKLLQGLGTGGLIEQYNIDPRIVGLVLLLLPLVVLVLITCVFMGAGGSSVKGEGRGLPGRKTDPALVGGGGKGKGKGGRDEINKQGAGLNGSSSSSGSGSGSASSRGGKKHGGPSDANKYLLGNNSGVSSWSALLGSMGFLGGETLDYKPLDILASLSEDSKTTTTTSSSSSAAEPNNVDHNSTALGSVFESMSALGSEMMKHIPYQHLLDQDIAQLLGSDFLDSDNPSDEEDPSSKLDKSAEERMDSSYHSKVIAAPKMPTYASIVATPTGAAKAIPPTADTAPKSSTQNKDQEPVHHIQKQEENIGRQSGKGPAGPGDDALKARVPSIPPPPPPPLRTRTPHPSGSFRESDRPKVPSNPTASSVTVKPANPAANVHQQASRNVGRDIGSKIFGFVQESQLLKNMDSLSGGLLGSAVATVAALASSAEATAGVIKNNLPDSVTDFTDELRQSFDHAMRVQEAEHEAAKQKSWGVRDAIAKIMQDDDDHVSAAAPSEPVATPAATATTAVRVPLPSATTTAPTSSKSAAANKQHPAEDISAHPTGPVAPRNIDADQQSELSSASGDDDDNAQHFPRASSGEAPMTEEVLAETDTPLSKELASAMETSQVTPSSLSNAVVGEAIAPSARTEHEDEDYYLEDLEDSGEEADKDSDGDGDNDEDDANDGDGAFVLAEGVPQTDRMEEPISSHIHLDEEGPKTTVHPHDEMEEGENSGSDSSSGGSIADDELPPMLSTSTSSDTLSRIPVQEMTVDEHGNKVPVSSEARRDSGFDLLV